MFSLTLLHSILYQAFSRSSDVGKVHTNNIMIVSSTIEYGIVLDDFQKAFDSEAAKAETT